jgi:23S rRNA (pseudouridine1915-N3)-methyltransferase
MKIKLITISSEFDKNAQALTMMFAQRLQHYTSFESLNIKPAKNSTIKQQQKSDAEQLLKKISSDDEVVLLDEKGKELTSLQLADFISKKMNTGKKSLCFVIGGAYGFDKVIYERSDLLMSLSKMTLPHQLAKVVFTEQLYRAFTILKNEKYHH